MAKSNGGQGLPIYKAYVFRDKDPVIDELRTMANDYFGHKVTGKDLKEIHKNGGPSVAALRGWFYGDTMRPQSPTVEAAGRAMGFKRQWVKIGRNR